MIFQENCFSCYVLLNDLVLLPDCLYFLRYLSICVLQLFSNQVVMWAILKITLSFYSGKMLKIYLDHKFQWSQKGFICEGNQVTLQPSGLGNFFVCKKFEVQTFLEVSEPYLSNEVFFLHDQNVFLHVFYL